MGENLDYYDTSDFKNGHPLHSQMNKKVLGKMKDKCGLFTLQNVFNPIREREKYQKREGHNEVTKKQITHENYKQALFNKSVFKHGMNMLRSKDHQIYGLHLNKTTLSPFTSKRLIKEDGQRNRGQLSVWRHNHQLLTNEAPLGPIINNT